MFLIISFCIWKCYRNNFGPNICRDTISWKSNNLVKKILHGSARHVKLSMIFQVKKMKWIHPWNQKQWEKMKINKSSEKETIFMCICGRVRNSECCEMLMVGTVSAPRWAVRPACFSQAAVHVAQWSSCVLAGTRVDASCTYWWGSAGYWLGSVLDLGHKYRLGTGWQWLGAIKEEINQMSAAFSLTRIGNASQCTRCS